MRGVSEKRATAAEGVCVVEKEAEEADVCVDCVVGTATTGIAAKDGAAETFEEGDFEAVVAMERADGSEEAGSFAKRRRWGAWAAGSKKAGVWGLCGIKAE